MPIKKLVSLRPMSINLIIVCLLSIQLFALTSVSNAAVHTVLPGIVWKDTSGNLLEAHGEGLIKVGSLYYQFGEDKTNGANFQNVNCYSTPDLTTFTFVNHVLTLQGSGDLGPNRIVERPHVIYNSSTAKYVMYMHIDNTNYSERKTGVATSSTICGNYSYIGSFKPLGHDSLDDDLFQEGANGYFMSEDRTDQKLQLYQLSSDYLTVSSLVATLNQYEGPALVKIGSTYYMFGSHLTGWATNDNQYSTATSLSGPWSAWKSFAPSGTNTCNSQTTNILTVSGSSTTSYIFLGDRWNSTNLSDSRYVWEPLTIKGTSVSMTCYDSWNIDTATGQWSSGVSNTYYRITNRNSGKVVDVAGQSTADGANVDQWTWNSGANQQWQFVDAGSGYFQIVNRNSGKCLDVTGASTANGANVDQWSCTGGNNQQWQMVAVGSYYQFVERGSGKCLDVVGNGTADGVNIDQWTCNGGNNQLWTRQ